MAGGAQAFATARVYWATLGALVLLTVADNVLVNILFDMFTERYSQFVNQGTAFVYCIWSGAILLWRRCARARERARRRAQSEELAALMPQSALGKGAAAAGARSYTPWYILVAIGLLNGSGNFFMAIGQPHTPGLTQTLLSQLNIPLVMLLSAVLLRKRASNMAVLGAVLIVGGSCASALRAVFDDGHGNAPIVVYWFSVTFFACGQLFLSGEKVFEEHSFGRFRTLDPMVMFCWTLCTQFVLGWALYPLQSIDALGGIELSQIGDVIVGGVLCALGQTSSAPGSPECHTGHAVVFFVYCSIDFWCYFAGLYVIQRGGANLMVVATSVALPLQQLVLCSSVLVTKRWVESFFWGDGVALALVLAGFLVYQASREGRAARGEADDDKADAAEGGSSKAAV